MDKDEIAPRGRQPGTESRRQREAEALRANLRKRKEQQRAREAPPDGEPGETGKNPADGAGA